MATSRAYTAVYGARGDAEPVSAADMLSGFHGNTCYNSSHCAFPSLCTLESSYRRYCSDTRFVTTIGRTLFDRTGLQEPGVYSCQRCSSPVALLDFGIADELGTYQCRSYCPLPCNSTTPDNVAESYQTSNCNVSCSFAPGELLGSATIGRSPLFVGPEPSERLTELRNAARDAHAAARALRVAEVAAYARAHARANQTNETAAVVAVLRADVELATAELEVAQYLEARARADIDTAASFEERGAHGAYLEAQQRVVVAEAALRVALDHAAANVAAIPFSWIGESDAPAGEAASLTIGAAEAEAAAAAATATAEAGGLRTLPLSDAMYTSWGRDDGWGRATSVRPSGGLLKLTSATVGVRGVGSAGWMLLRPGRALQAFRVEMDVLVAGGSGGSGFALSYAPVDYSAMRAAITENAGQDGASRASEAAAAYGPRGTTSLDANATGGDDNATSSSSGTGGERGFGAPARIAAAGITDPFTASYVHAASDPLTSHFVVGARPERPVPPASASRGLGATVEYGYGRPPRRGAGLSVSFSTQPVHSVDVWLNGSRLAHSTYPGCPHDDTSTFGASCMPCAVCVGCPPCVPCASQSECPLRPGRKFVRVVIQLRVGTSMRPSTIEAHHNGLSIFRRPVVLPEFEGQPHWQLVLSAGTESVYDDDHWVDNLRLACAPTKPPPPSLVRATTRALELAWFPPHHGGDPIALYRLQRRTPRGWVTAYVGNATTRVVTPLVPATQHLLRVQAYNSVGWGPYSDAGSFATASPPLTFDLKPPHNTHVAGGVVRCGGRLYSAGGQHAAAPAGVGGKVGGRPRKYLAALEQYDTPTRSWLRRTNMRTPRSHPGVACVRDRTLLVVGGYGAVGEAPYEYEGPLIASEEYDPDTDTWYTRSDAPSARYHATVASEPHGHVFIAGGYGSEYAWHLPLLATPHACPPHPDRFLARGRYGHSAAAYGTEGVLATLERYDPWNGQWVRKAPMPYAAYGVGLGVFDCERRCKLLVAGGYGVGGTFVRVAAVYDPLLDTWTVASPLPAPRFGPTMLSDHAGPRIYAVGGYELKLSPQPSATALGGEADAAAAMAAARAATMALHGDTLKSVFEYHIDADAWWPVPSDTRLWRLVNAFDWRHSPVVAVAARREADRAIYQLIPNRSKNTLFNLTNEDGPWRALNRYVGVAEYARPAPARCRHGRGLLGCLRGIGVQRDVYGHEVPAANRSAPDRTAYPAIWSAPLRLAPSECTDCTLLLDPAFYPSMRANATADDLDDPPRLPPEADIYRDARMANSTLASPTMEDALTENVPEREVSVMLG